MESIHSSLDNETVVLYDDYLVVRVDTEEFASRATTERSILVKPVLSGNAFLAHPTKLSPLTADMYESELKPFVQMILRSLPQNS